MDTVSQRPYYVRAPAHRELQVASHACAGQRGDKPHNLGAALNK
jgi:hypothetical protein